jgi:hypothetical protein
MMIEMRDRSELILDKDVQAICEFMLANIPATRLIAVANEVGKIAPLLWGRYPQEEVATLDLRRRPISIAGTQSTASELELPHSRADGDFAAERI